MSLPTYFFALSEDGVANLSHGLAAITSARKRRVSARRRSAVTRIIAVLATGAGLLVASLMTGCERSPSGPLQQTVPSGSPPPTPAFATNALRTAADPDHGDNPPPNASVTAALASAGSNKMQRAAGDDVCSVAGTLEVKRVSDEHFEVSSSDVETLAASLNQSTIAEDGRLTLTHTENGLPGLQVQGVGANADCGLQSGDIVVSVNGISVANRSELAKSRARFLAADQLELLIERERRTKRLVYVVRKSG